MSTKSIDTRVHAQVLSGCFGTGTVGGQGPKIPVPVRTADAFERIGGTGSATAVVSGRAAAYMHALTSNGVPRNEAIAKTREWLQQR